jgi:hypothetical protein
MASSGLLVLSAGVAFHLLSQLLGSCLAANRASVAHLNSLADLVGQVVRLPKTDEFGAVLPELNQTSIVVLANCSSCSMNAAGTTKFPRPPGPVIYLMTDSSNRSALRNAWLQSRRDTWVVIDRSGSSGPPGLFDSPAILRLSGDGRIISASGVFR